ncbi:MAG: hypothetical protein LC797_19495 [Chloroflexi bacterium]|nr:hypothetical protein [Chloroflexota bacterium]
MLELRAPAALLAAGVYAHSGFFQFQSVAAQPYVGLAAWVPVALLGAELALRADRFGPRWRGWLLSGVAVSQSLAVWPGQGSYYCILLLGAWTLVRALPTQPRRAAAHVAAPLLIAVGLDAAGLLPRLEFQSLSTLADGYPVSELVGGWRPADLVRLVAPGAWDVGIGVLGLSAVGLLSLTGRPRAEFVIAGLCWVGGLVLASSIETPLHALVFHVLPGFGRLHAHVSERILIVSYFAPALLAGLGLQVLAARPIRRLLLFAIIFAVGAEALAAGRLGVDHQVGAPWDGLTRVESYASAFAPTPAAQFLQAQARAGDRAYRYVGYGPVVNGLTVPYTQRFADSATRALLVNNRAITLGLEDVQGYNAVHLSRFDAYLNVLNAGQTQNYHDGQVFAAGIATPLLDLLGVRYVVVPANEPTAGQPVAFQDPTVTIFEHSTALPRGWTVHAAQVATVEEALRLINSGAVDPRQTVLLEQPPADPTASYVVFDQITYPGWVAYLDGRPYQPIPADGLLQAVAIPPGTRTVELRFESPTLHAGLAVSAATLLAALAPLLASAIYKGTSSQPIPREQRAW